MDLGFRVVEERIRAQNWLGLLFFVFFSNDYLIQKLYKVLWF